VPGAKRECSLESLTTGGFMSSFRRLQCINLWTGLDLRTVQQWLGHSDMESTMRYLKPSCSQQARDKVNEVFAGVMVEMDLPIRLLRCTFHS
jgi:integrase